MELERDLLVAKNFDAAFARFQELVTAKSGKPFSSFDDGMAAVWESYKPRLREHALSKLSADSWQSADIGTGRILDQTIEAIEIQDAGKNLTNNLVFWQNRYDMRTAIIAPSLKPSRIRRLEMNWNRPSSTTSVRIVLKVSRLSKSPS